MHPMEHLKVGKKYACLEFYATACILRCLGKVDNNATISTSTGWHRELTFKCHQTSQGVSLNLATGTNI